MTHMTDEQIEDAFILVREKFEARNNETGLEMLDSVEARWEAMGELSDRQLAWLEKQQSGAWRKKPRSKSAQSAAESPSQAPLANNQVKISAGLLDQLANDVQRISQILEHLRGQ